ncbi:MAG: LysM peptidoglycan-binding domain-containing protein [Bacilli bacterium]|nr:LysM peptidoglycan-binding domain-containing protein [Bacilli bacterium]
MTYTVKRGDTLYGISNQYGVSASELKRINNLTSDVIQVGQVLQIPTTTGTNPSSTFLYTVKKGDSLYNIAKVYGTTVNELIQINQLKNTNLSIGQKLIVPESDETVTEKPSYITYTVKKGDSLYSIAKQYGTSIASIQKDNALKNNVLSIGQVLRIRTTPSSSVEVLECFGEDYTPVTNEITYTVKKGDSLYQIAKKYNTSVDTIKKKNNLTSNTLSIGQVLKI